MKRWIGAAAAAMAAAHVVPAAAEVDALVSRALTLEKDGRMADAYALLAPAETSRAGDPDFDYALGIAASDAGHVPEAILAFQRVLSVQPQNGEARAEIARAYARMGDAASARAQFDTVLDDPSLPDPVRQRFNRIVQDIDRAQDTATDVSAFADVGAGYDSNINTATGLTSLTLPLFAFLGPASLSGAATRQESAFVTGAGGVSVKTPLARQLAGFASVLGDVRKNTLTDIFDQATLTGTIGGAYTTAAHDVVSLSGQVQRFWLGGDGYRNAYGVTGQYTHRLAGGSALTFAAQWFRLDYDVDKLRDADRYTFSVSRIDRTTVLSLTGGKEETRRELGDAQSNAFAGLRLGIEQPVAPKLAVLAGAGVEGRWYDQADTLFLKKRRDTQFDASLAVKYLLTPAVYVRPQVTYTRNASNIALYDYGRVVASIGLHAEF